MRIGTVAARANVNEQTLRYYERVGLLREPARSPNGYRDYSPETIALVRFIKRAQELGFTLDEARVLSELRQAPGRSCGKVQALATAKLADINQRINDLLAVRRALRLLVESCGDPPDGSCPILDALNHSSGVVRRRKPKGRKR